jgi:FkbM family methyltransferase
MCAYCKHPFDTIKRYVTGKGAYPCEIQVRTRSGLYCATLYCSDDIQTLSEVFCRRDYQSKSGTKVIVDIGANIGLSTAYLLCEHPDARSYVYEPVPMNITKLRTNVSVFSSRVRINECAVGTSSGTILFSTEVTGRYGAIKSTLTDGEDYRTISVEVRDVNEIISEILDENGHIDLMKIDIEGLEQEVIRSIDSKYYSRIHKITYEPNLGTLPMSIYPSLSGIDGLF